MPFDETLGTLMASQRRKLLSGPREPPHTTPHFHVVEHTLQLASKISYRSVTNSFIDEPEHSGRRLVLILARHLEALTFLGSVSKGFELRHWAVLILNEIWTADKLRSLILDLKSSTQVPPPIELGVLFHLHIIGEDQRYSQLSEQEPFTSMDLFSCFPDCALAFVGSTELQRKEISEIGAPFIIKGNSPLTGAEIHHKHRDYDIWHNNCQNWARYLVESITGKRLCPKTISDVLNRLGGKSRT